MNPFVFSGVSSPANSSTPIVVIPPGSLDPMSLLTRRAQLTSLGDGVGLGFVGDLSSLLFGTPYSPSQSNCPDQTIIQNYQRYYNDAWLDTVQRFNQGKITIPVGMSWETILGQHTDAIARARLRNFLSREGIAEGPGADVQVNRWLRDPSGSGNYRIPDLRLRGSNTMVDGTIGSKTADSPQIKQFVEFSGGGRVIIMRPTVGPRFGGR